MLRLTVLMNQPDLVDRLQQNARLWRTGLRDLGLSFPEADTPIVPIAVGPTDLAIKVWQSLIELGVYVNPVVYPAVPHDAAILRTTVMATHTADQLAHALGATQESRPSFRTLLNRSTGHRACSSHRFCKLRRTRESLDWTVPKAGLPRCTECGGLRCARHELIADSRASQAISQIYGVKATFSLPWLANTGTILKFA